MFDLVCSCWTSSILNYIYNVCNMSSSFGHVGQTKKHHTVVCRFIFMRSSSDMVLFEVFSGCVSAGRVTALENYFFFFLSLKALTLKN